MTRREQIIELRRRGLTVREIMRQLKMSSPSLVHYYMQRADILNGVGKQRLIACIRDIEANAPEPLKKHITKTIQQYSASSLQR
jgi:DNA-binding CsgD family transcriptional regulator